MKFNVGDLIRCRGTKLGIIIKVNDHKEYKEQWIQVMWYDSVITWEDVFPEDNIFEVINEF